MIVVYALKYILKVISIIWPKAQSFAVVQKIIEHVCLRLNIDQYIMSAVTESIC